MDVSPLATYTNAGFVEPPVPPPPLPPLPPFPPPVLHPVENVHVYGAVIATSARSATPLTVTVIVPCGSADEGVAVTTVLLTSMLSVAGIIAPPGPVIAIVFEFTVAASGSSLNVIVI